MAHMSNIYYGEIFTKINELKDQLETIGMKVDHQELVSIDLKVLLLLGCLLFKVFDIGKIY